MINLRLRLIHNFSLILLFPCLTMAALQNHSTMQAKNSELKNVSQQINATSSGISQTKQQRDKFQMDLKNIEINLGITSQQIADLDKQLALESQILLQLKNQENQYVLNLNQHRAELRQQMRLYYLLGQNDYLKTFLNQQNPAEVNRLTRYYAYIHKARIQTIHQLNQMVTEIKTTQAHIQSHHQILAKLKQTQFSQQLALQNKLQQRQEILKKLNHTLQTHQQKLQELQINRQNLQAVVDHLKTLPQQQTRQAIGPTDNIPLTRLLGKLSWPTQGAIIQHYAHRIEKSNFTANAVLINAPSGQPVHAIYPGKVVFADWLRGLGLLIIIDHGNGFMSLYGHNKTLLKKTTEKVEAGDTIALVGNTGGYDKPALYFQIRKEGKPLNPERWCRY